MLCGWATELWSRPAKRDADGYRGWVGDPVRTERIMMLERKYRSYRNRNYQLRPELPRVYPYEQTVRRLPFQQRNEYENQDVPPAPPPLTFQERRELRDYARAYTRNYMFRMIPHTVGWFPCAQPAARHATRRLAAHLLTARLPAGTSPAGSSISRHF